MALKWLDGAEAWSDSGFAARAYADTAAVSTSTARVSPGTRCWSLNGGRMKTPSLGVQNTWVIGFGLLINSVILFQCRLFSGSSEQCRIEVENSGGLPRFKLVRGTTTLATSSTFAAAQWHYFELKVDVLTSGATVELRRNEVTILSASGLNLANTGANGADAVGFGYQATGTSQIDDIYICDSTGSVNNNFLGDSVCMGILPQTEGHLNEFTPSTGTDNAALVDETSGTQTTDFVSSDTNGQQDYYVMADLPPTGLGTIYGVRLSGSWAMATTGTRVARYRYYNGSTEFTIGANISAATTVVVELPQISELNPDTGVPWVKTDIDNAEFGVEVVS